jgi:O-glycosyl hydrolase
VHARKLWAIDRLSGDGLFFPAIWRKLACSGGILTLFFLFTSSHAATVTIDGSQTHQVIEGFGVNANHRGWNNDELKPVLDGLIDQAGMTLFRVVYDNADWEGTNDNSNASVMNWPYYRTIYSSPDFQKLWDTMAYLNKKGITNGIMPNFQGFGPAWMSQPYPNYRSLAIGQEHEWAEMIASALVYARYSNHLQFTLVGPNNEPDLPGSGVGIANGSQYALTLHALAQQLDSHGLSDLRFVGPDFSVGSTNWLPDIMADSVVMAKLAHFGMHSYSAAGVHSEYVADFIQQSPYPARTFWMTEFNVWCDVCQYAYAGTNSWLFARGTVEYLLAHLANGASAGLVWDGYDSPYLNNYDDYVHWSFWGLFAVNTTNDVPKTYTPRKGFYTLSQISKYVRPGARRISISGSPGSLQMLAFYHPDSGQLTITGVNPDASVAALSGGLASLPDITNLNLFYTTSSKNLQPGASVAVSNGGFSVNIPADSVFTLVGIVSTNPHPALPAAGTYHGLFQEAERVQQHSGSFTLTVNPRGVYTGSLRRGADNFSLHGTFDAAGNATNTIFEARTNAWTVTMSLDSSNGNWITGTIGNDQWQADLLANRAAFASRTNPATAFMGKYTMIIPGGTNDDGTLAEGDGYAAASVSAAGALNVKGSLADGMALRQTVLLGQAGEWPLYAPLNGGKDSILGWLTNQPASGLQGIVSWIKTANPKAKVCPAGMTNLVSVAGWTYTQPTTATRIISVTNGMAAFEGGNLGGPLFNLFTLTTANHVIDNSVSNKFSLSFTPASGLFSGSLTPSGTTRRINLRGAVSQHLNAGFGYFLSTNRSGQVLLSQ